MFGEIIPQAVISRNALFFGARTIWFTKLVLLIFYPIAWPIAKMLDHFLGDEIPTVYSKSELMDIISEHEDSEHSDVDADEERILHGALQFSHTRVREVMTPAERVVLFDENTKLNDDFFTEVQEQGFSRLPIYSGEKSNVIGILYVKDLITEAEDISIAQTEEAFEKEFLAVDQNEMLDKVLTKMLKQRRHLAVVQAKSGRFLGVVTLEDIIEEIIQVEIEDEDDEEEI